jgi:hypothetical protein
LLAFLGGSGSAWRCFEIRTGMQAESRERFTAAIVAHKELESKFAQIYAGNENYSRLRDSLNWKQDRSALMALVNQRCLLALLKRDVEEIEVGLAKLEGRPSRTFPFGTVPPPLPDSIQVLARGDTAKVVFVRPDETIEFTARVFPGQEPPGPCTP